MTIETQNAAPREFDVRPILRSGGEPFQAIMEAVNALRPGQALRLLAPFRPQPLFKVMEGRGFSHEAQEIQGGDWEVLSSRTRRAPPSRSLQMPTMRPPGPIPSKTST